MFDAMAPGRVLVMDAVPDASCWGGNASRLAEAADLAGVVADGRVRDADDIRANDFPVFSAGTTPRTGQCRTEIVAVDDPVDVDGVRVATDDVVVADLTGVVVVPEAEAEAVADAAADLLESEREIERAIDDGATHEDLRDREF
jgi:regulator of RNase E activity RraA